MRDAHPRLASLAQRLVQTPRWQPRPEIRDVGLQPVDVRSLRLGEREQRQLPAPDAPPRPAAPFGQRQATLSAGQSTGQTVPHGRVDTGSYE